ncbi:hypothetical protein EV363DRAFT_1138899, partial [Boletus edulis]
MVAQPRVQPLRLPRPTAVLDKDARKELRLVRQEKNDKYQADLTDAVQEIDKMTKTLASQHHKSIRQVEGSLIYGQASFCRRREKVSPWNAFCWKKRQSSRAADNPNGGKTVLHDLVTGSKEEYHTLTADEKENLVAEYSEFRADKMVRKRVSVSSKINDATHTLQAVESELDNLKARTGVEAILYASRGTTDLPLRGLAFATGGVKDFMASVMGVDKIDLVSKMEGFAIQGMRGAAKNHQERVSHLRGQIREIITRKLHEVTGDPSAKMQWKYYFRNVVMRHKVMIKGWPSTIPFANLSDMSSSYSQLEMLLRKWESGAISWEVVSDEELETLREERNIQIEAGEIEDPSRRPRADKGTKRKRD